MKTATEFLSIHSESMPRWLEQAHVLDSASLFEEFMSSGIVFYPGSGLDGEAVRVFGSSHACHCFVYADYLMTEAQLLAELDNPRYAFAGYRVARRISYDPALLLPTKSTLLEQEKPWVTPVEPYCFMVILERDDALTDRHGPRRLAVLFAGLDAYVCFDGIFCQKRITGTPCGILLQDHGFGGNYSQFGADGLLERMAIRAQRRPQFLLVGESTRPWNGYVLAEPSNREPGGSLRPPRVLYEKLPRRLPILETVCFSEARKRVK